MNQIVDKNPATGQEITSKYLGQKGHLAVDDNTPFVALQDDKRGWLLWGNPDELIGKKVKFQAVNKNGSRLNLIGRIPEHTIARYENPAESQASVGTWFSLASPGLWRKEVYIEDKLFGSVVVEVR